jgi:hypothetical protein
MEFTIDKNVPVPTEKRACKWPFATMEVGDSVWFQDEKVNGKAYRSAMAMGARRGTKFVARRENDGLRIWRAE